jgi:drug/metabolite transporter (DMT)-like permease
VVERIAYQSVAYLILTALLWGIAYGINPWVMQFLSARTMGTLLVLIGLPLFAAHAGKCAVWGVRLRCMLVGAVQIGAMYYFLQIAYSCLSGAIVALLCMETPLLICLFDDLLSWQLAPFRLFTAAAAVAVTVFALCGDWGGGGSSLGIASCTMANACYALGQVAYRRLHANRRDLPNGTAVFWLYAGATLLWLPLMPFLPAQSPPQPLRLDVPAVAAVLFLLVIGGLGNYWWNRGISRTSIGAVAICNNLTPLFGALFSLPFTAGLRQWGRILFALGALTVLLILDASLSARHSECSARSGGR